MSATGGARRTIAYGEWPSAITTDLVVAASVGIGGVQPAGPHVFWSELRPSEGGRVQIVRRRPDGTLDDLLPEGFSARTRVHEYGGGAWLASAGWLYFTNWADQRLYKLRVGDDGAAEAPEAITPEPPEPHALRYADMIVAGPWLVCVRERHDLGGEARNEVVAVDVRGEGREVVTLVTGPDFVSSPRLSPDGRLLAWLQWDHPNMPWDSTELCLAPVVLTLGAATTGPTLVVAGGEGESICQPRWRGDGTLHFCTDQPTGWWNLRAMHQATGAVRTLTDLEAEVGIPEWIFGQSRIAFLPGNRLAFVATGEGRDRLYVQDGEDDPVVLDLPYTEISSLSARGSSLLFVGASFTQEPAVVEVRLDGTAMTGREVLRPPRDLGLEPGWFSEGHGIEFPSGPIGGEPSRTAYALHYPPTNPEAVGPEGSAPPLLVIIHGGPTSMARARLSLEVQYWTSRGFAVVDVNYGGSTGYGRAYRDLLKGAWGVVDVEDCVAAATHLAAQGLADPARLCIRGGSAGGFTTLAALAFTDVFAAGANSFGVADLSALAEDTHKFESRYLDGLVGPYPEAKAVYDERSPIHHVDRLDRPLITFQGLEDEVVPPNQSEMIVEAVRAKGVPVAYLAFEGEQHGFRKAETIKAVLGSELAFYGRVLGFHPAGDLPDVEIANL